jgi:hypothetical protein
VLDVSEKQFDHLKNVASGSYDLVLRDLRAVLPTSVVVRLQEACTTSRVQEAFGIRRELINFKKICLHVWHSARELERELQQLTTFFYRDIQGDLEGGFEHGEKYIVASNALTECRGVLTAIIDARNFVKAICCVPRHPRGERPSRLQQLPYSLGMYKMLEQSCSDSKGGKDIPPSKCTKTEVNYMHIHSALDAEMRKAVAALSATGVDAEGKDEMHFVKGNEEALASFVESVLIARGATKALCIRAELVHFVSVLENLTKTMGTTSAKHDQQQRTVPTRSGDRGRSLRMCTCVLRDLHKWLLAIHTDGGCGHVFVAPDDLSQSSNSGGSSSGSGGTSISMFMPPDFELVQQLSRVRQRIEASGLVVRMREAIRSQGWPPPLALCPAVQGKHECTSPLKCGGRYSKLWLRQGVCAECELQLRAQGRCPFRQSCSSNTSSSGGGGGGGGSGSYSTRRPFDGFCPHECRCFRCDIVLGWNGCALCGLVRGDGEDVRRRVEQLLQCEAEQLAMKLRAKRQVEEHQIQEQKQLAQKPQEVRGSTSRCRPKQLLAVFLDFDRTFCSTKRGASPLHGSCEHSIDPDLLWVATVCQHCYVITRNVHKAE